MTDRNYALLLIGIVLTLSGLIAINELILAKEEVKALRLENERLEQRVRTLEPRRQLLIDPCVIGTDGDNDRKQLWTVTTPPVNGATVSTVASARIYICHQ